MTTKARPKATLDSLLRRKPGDSLRPWIRRAKPELYRIMQELATVRAPGDGAKANERAKL